MEWPDRKILTFGPFTMSGTCKDLGGGKYEAFSYMTTTQAGSSVNGYMESYLEADFEPIDRWAGKDERCGVRHTNGRSLVDGGRRGICRP